MALSKRTDALAGKMDADNKVTADHFNEVNRSVASVAKGAGKCRRQIRVSMRTRP